jgi:hypothetical protein
MGKVLLLLAFTLSLTAHADTIDHFTITGDSSDTPEVEHVSNGSTVAKSPSHSSTNRLVPICRLMFSNPQTPVSRLMNSGQCTFPETHRLETRLGDFSPIDQLVLSSCHETASSLGNA